MLSSLSLANPVGKNGLLSTPYMHKKTGYDKRTLDCNLLTEFD